jgi:uncharacterized coiled-coil protein SlyX
VHDVIVCSECQREERQEYETRIAELEKVAATGATLIAAQEKYVKALEETFKALEAALKKADAMRSSARDVINCDHITGQAGNDLSSNSMRHFTGHVEDLAEDVSAYDEARKAVQR